MGQWKRQPNPQYSRNREAAIAADHRRSRVNQARLGGGGFLLGLGRGPRTVSCAGFHSRPECHREHGGECRQADRQVHADHPLQRSDPAGQCIHPTLKPSGFAPQVRHGRKLALALTDREGDGFCRLPLQAGRFQAAGSRQRVECGGYFVPPCPLSRPARLRSLSSAATKPRSTAIAAAATS